MGFDFRFIEIKYKQLTENVKTYLQELYGKSEQQFSAASPYGHILQALTNIFQSGMGYLKYNVNQYDLSNKNILNERTIKTTAIIAGHNPVRSQSANGTLRLRAKTSINISEEIPGSKITINNGIQLKNKTNGLNYYIDLGTDSISYALDSNVDIYLSIVQGEVNSQGFTGSNEVNQSFDVVVSRGRGLDNYRVAVTVNGVVWSKRDSLFDMLPNEQSYYTRTAFNGGLEVWFGNGNFGAIPPLGSEIIVNYVACDGSVGNLPILSTNDWIFVDSIFDGFGGLVDIDNTFDVFIFNEIGFGSDAEDVSFTKAIIPYISRNFVLARPEQFVFVLRRLNIFSQIDAYTTEKNTTFDDGDPTNDSVVFLFLVPDFRKFIVPNGNTYFDLPLSAFYLDESEQRKIIAYVNSQGIVGLGVTLKILQPTIVQYVINVYARLFNDIDQNNIRQSIIDVISNYFIETKRRDRIPKSDLIRLIEDVNGIDSVDVEFISKNNEDYHREFIVYRDEILKSDPTATPSTITLEGYDETNIIGIDSQLGDILISKNEFVVIRGGFNDRFGVNYEEKVNPSSLSAVNLFVIESVNRPIEV